MIHSDLDGDSVENEDCSGDEDSDVDNDADEDENGDAWWRRVGLFSSLFSFNEKED